MIEIEQVGKSYDGIRALDGFSLNVAKGELLGLVGPNGAGKTTLIKILATLLVPSAGTVRIGGINVRQDRNAVKRLVGYLPDQPGLYQDMRLREFLQFFADAFHVSRERQANAIDQALSRSGLAERQQAYVEELSFGLKQRLLLAKTLLHGPKVLLLDEPATGLDPIARLDLRRQLKELNAEGVTILISSHILSDLEDICTRVALISGGKNAVDADGYQVIQLEQAATARVYEIEVTSPMDAARAVAKDVPGATVVSAEGAVLTVELQGGNAEGASLLRHLVTSGVEVARFDYRHASLEERYQKAFGGGPS
jgi:ABC-2 type transport system ATP-binding protein